VELNLRQAIVQRMHDKNTDELRDVIEDSIGNVEMTLPGLGVLFEIIWSHSTPGDQMGMVNTLHEHMNDPSPA
jgi:small acid-soluble spore protein I (minor)